jgi:putative FmdB family regulatory protein
MDRMPIYEFRCGRCEARFEALVAPGTEAEACRECGTPGAERVLSVPAQPPKLVKTGTGYRRQDEKNRVLREKTKADFKAKRRQARDAAKARKGS